MCQQVELVLVKHSEVRQQKLYKFLAIKALPFDSFKRNRCKTSLLLLKFLAKFADAGLDMAEADALRRAMSGRHRGHKHFEEIKEKFSGFVKKKDMLMS
jgi:hypothetical protein